jgi:guanylate kinase
VVLVIDVQGARQVRRRSWPAVFVFVLPPSYAELETRLGERKGDTEEQIQRRLTLAREEVAAVPEYDYVLVNDTVGACVERLQAIVLADRARRSGDTAGARAQAIAAADQARREAMASVIAPIAASFARARA